MVKTQLAYIIGTLVSTIVGWPQIFFCRLLEFCVKLGRASRPHYDASHDFFAMSSNTIFLILRSLRGNIRFHRLGCIAYQFILADTLQTKFIG